MYQTWLDERHLAEAEKHWGKAGAGLMLFLGGRVLLLRRSKAVDQPGTWGIPGGAANEGWYGDEQIKPNEAPSEAALFEVAKREAKEELGRDLPAFDRFGVVTYTAGNFVFKTFLGKLDAHQYRLVDSGSKWVLYRGTRPVSFKLDWENDDWRWFKTHEVVTKAQPLHFGVKHVISQRSGLFKNVDLPESVQRTPTVADLKKLKPELVRAAQKVYDDWDENEDEFAGGGVCHLIADATVGVLSSHGIDAGTVSAQVGEQHVWAVAKVAKGVYEVDIPPSVYERGGGYAWTKIPDVEFGLEDIVIHRLDADPASFEEYLGEAREVGKIALGKVLGNMLRYEPSRRNSLSDVGSDPVLCWGSSRLKLDSHLPGQLSRLLPSPMDTNANWLPFVTKAFAMGLLKESKMGNGRMGRLLGRLVELANALKPGLTTKQRNLLQRLVGRANRAFRQERTLTPGSAGIEPGPEWEGVSLGDVGSLLRHEDETILLPQHTDRIVPQSAQMRFTVQGTQIWAWRPREEAKPQERLGECGIEEDEAADTAIEAALRNQGFQPSQGRWIFRSEYDNAKQVYVDRRMIQAALKGAGFEQLDRARPHIWYHYVAGWQANVPETEIGEPGKLFWSASVRKVKGTP